MRIFRIKVATLMIAFLAFFGGSYVGTAMAAGKIALVTDVGGRGPGNNGGGPG